jgi:hypothetical protein
MRRLRSNCRCDVSAAAERCCIASAAGSCSTPGPVTPIWASDQLVLPPHTPHAATVGAEGVRYVEAARQG